MTRIDRRGFLGLGAAALLAASATACGFGGSDAGLRVAWYGGAPLHEALEKALAAFTGDHPDAQLATEKAPFQDYWDKLATQAAGGRAPDVFRMSMSYFTEYAQRGALLDLRDVAGGIRVDDLDPTGPVRLGPARSPRTRSPGCTSSGRGRSSRSCSRRSCFRTT